MTIDILEAAQQNCDLLKMESLLKAAQDFEQVTDEFNEKVFLNFMKQITIWDFYNISKEEYLAMSEQEKRLKISNYYSNMKSKDSSKFYCVFVFVCF